MHCAGNNLAQYGGMVFGIVRDTIVILPAVTQHSVLADVFLDLSLLRGR
jgi:hypothetical protein